MLRLLSALAAATGAPLAAQVDSARAVPADSSRACGPNSAAADCLAPAAVGPGERRFGTDALVLSGGGSRGLAHVGVLRRLEEQGYDPDIVVGTSIGALVSALYAVGYPAEEIRQQVMGVDWGELFTPAPLVLGPDRSVRYPMFTIDQQVDSLRFSRGIVPQWRMNRVLARLLFDAEARSRGDFDRLARRYRAIATDLRTGAPVVLAHGDLARAVRASMAVPGVFAPVRWDTLDLIDGGIADNLPLQTARAVGGRYLVAVDVGRPPPRVTSRGPLAVLGRSVDLLQDNAQRDSLPANVTIVPPLPTGESGVSFPSDPTPVFDLGYAAAVRDGASIRSSGRGRRAPPPAPARFTALVVEAPDSALAALIRHRFRHVAPGPYDAAAVLTAIDRLYTTGLFEALWPRVEDSPTGARLVIRAESPPRQVLAGGVGYDSDRAGRAWVALQRAGSVGHTPTQLGAAASFTGIEQWASIDVRAHSPHIAPLVLGLGVHGSQTDVRFTGDENVEVSRLGLWGSMETYRLLSEQVAVLVVRGERISVSGGDQGWIFGPTLRIESPQSERPLVGLTRIAELGARWGAFRYQRAQLRGSHGFQAGPVLGALLADVVSVRGNAPPDVLPALGDQYLLPGFAWGEERGKARMLGGVDLAAPVMAGGYLRLRTRAGAVASGLDEVFRGARWSVGSELGIAYRTPFGALSLGLASNTRSRPRLVLDFGADF